ncbi:MAG TPA: 3-oxoacyl-ACP reductase family protein [Candidatus Saccharimonadales bacterium]
MKRFERKTVVVTGGARGLGAATIRRFASEGANVVINYVAHDEAAKALASELAKYGVKILPVKADIGNEADVQKMAAKIIAEFGSIDILVNNAGIVIDLPFTEKTTQQWQRTMNVNLNGVYYCTKHFMPHINEGGSVINIASTNGIDTYHPDSIDYDVSKAGVIMFTKAMARDLAPKIRINCIAPGWFDTDINADLPKDYVQKESEKIAMGRFGKPDEIASVAAFLASDDAAFMTGSVIVVDGGYGGAV